jgi:cis-3-alkyl-4-acyloxetan-2-one decarboxylase
MKTEPWRQEYPFESHGLDLDGARYHYLDEGTGKPILFVHGNPTWSFAFRKLVLALRETHRCLAVDHIGCGLSDKPLDYPYRLEQHIDNLCRLIEHHDLQEITLVAHDWGGCIGMGAAVALSDRFARLILMNTAAFRSDFIPKRIAVCRIPFLGALGVRGLNLFARAAISQAVADKSVWTNAAKEGYLAPYDSWDHRVAIHRFVQDIPRTPADPSYETLQEIEDGLEQFREFPVKLIWGMRDWCFHPGFLREFQSRWPHAETVEFPHAAHYLFEDDPQRCVDEIRDFLKPA